MTEGEKFAAVLRRQLRNGAKRAKVILVPKHVREAVEPDEFFTGEDWLECELEYLKTNWGVLDRYEIAYDLRRTFSSVNMMASRLKLGPGKAKERSL